MTKLISLRVVVPADDEVTTADVQAALRGILGVLPVSRVGDAADGPRMHWAAVDVLRGQDRTEAPLRPRRAGRKAVALTPAAE